MESGGGVGDWFFAPLTTNFVRAWTVVTLQLSPGQAEEIYAEPFGTAGMAAEVRNGCTTRRPGSLPRDRNPQMSTKETETEIDN